MDRVPAETPEEVYLSFRYASVINSHISAWYHQDQIYLPLGELFDLLQINQQLDLPNRTIRGFFLREENTYELNVGRGQALMGGKSFDVEASEILVGERDIFVRPILLDRLFGLHLSFDMSALTLWLETEQPMPVALAAARARNRLTLHDPQAVFNDAPLLYDRNRKWLGGGLLDYTVSSGLYQGQAVQTAALRAGMEVLGGDLRWDISGSVGSPFLLRNQFEWRYVLEENPWLTNVQLGTLGSGGLRPLAYNGITLTNEPNEIRSLLLTSYLVEGVTKPDWEVELYLNDHLVDFGRADASGHYRFTIPLPYGTSDVRLVHYGPAGEVEPERRRLEIPYSFLPQGETSYTLHLGQTAGSALLTSRHRPLVQAHMARGLTERVTARVGIDYVGDTLFSRPHIYGAIFSRLGNHYLMSVKVAPSLLLDMAMSGHFPSQATLNLRYTRHSGRQMYNPLDSWKESIQAGGYLPFHVGALPVSFRLMGSRERHSSESRYELRGQLLTRLRQTHFYIDYQSTAYRRGEQFGMTNALLSPSFVGSLPTLHGLLAPLRGTSLRAQLDIDPLRWSVSGVRMEILTRALKAGHLHLMLNRSFQSGMTVFGLRFTYDLSSTRTTTSVQHHRNQTIFVQSTQGSIGFDGQRGQLVFANREAVGQSAVSIRHFVDENANGVKDHGEKWVEHASVQLAQGGSLWRSDSITVHVRNLRPYTRYNVTVDESTIRNPLWVPRHTTFSFISEPNTYKPINIPLYVAGVVEGMVTRKTSLGQVPVSGIRVHLHRLNGSLEQTLTTFSDGSFYSITLPPGEYEARIDSVQLARLGLGSEVSPHVFRVRSTASGDYIEGLDFVLEEPHPTSVPHHVEPESPLAREEREGAEEQDVEPVHLSQARGVQPEESVQFYTVQPSEIGLMNIARKVYGDGYLWPKIYVANRDKLNDPDLIYPGQRLRIPPKAPLILEERTASTDTVWTYYTVRPSDIGLMDIARKVYQDGRLWPKIWLANSDNMISPDLIYPGQRLRIPPRAPLTPEERAAAAEALAQAYYTIHSLEIGLMNIARKVYGDGYLWPKIYVANRDKLNDPDLIYPGQRLRIPPKAPLTSEEKAVLDLFMKKGRSE